MRLVVSVLVALMLSDTTQQDTRRERINKRDKRLEVAELVRQASNETHIFEVIFRANRVSGTHFVATSNYAYRHVTVNWIASLARHNLTKFVVLCLDEETLLFLASGGYLDHVALVPRDWFVYIYIYKVIWVGIFDGDFF
jgi:hypothetical protein